MYMFKQHHLVLSVLIVCIIVFFMQCCLCLYEHFTDTLYENVSKFSVCKSKCESLGDACKAYTYNQNTKICNTISQPTLVSGQYQAGTALY